jgi:hypothetical protein
VHHMVVGRNELNEVREGPHDAAMSAAFRH